MLTKPLALAAAFTLVAAAPALDKKALDERQILGIDLGLDILGLKVGLDLKVELNKKVDALSPSQKVAFFQQQAVLRKRFGDIGGDIDQLAANFKAAVNPAQTWPVSQQPVSRSVKVKRAPPKNCTKLTGEIPTVLKNKDYSTCLYETNSQNIDDPVLGLQTVSKTNWASGHIPPPLRGTFFMEGNPLPSECVSTASAYWNATAKVWEIPSWQPRTWSSSPDIFGRYYEQESFRSAAINFRTACAEVKLGSSNETNLATNGTVCSILQYSMRNLDTTGFGDYWTVQIDSDFHIRATTNKPLRGLDGKYSNYYYNFWRIVDDKGKRTPYYYTRYANLTGKFFGYEGQPFVHLKPTQYVALN